MQRFREMTGNSDFRISKMTWISLGFLLLIYPLASIAPGADLSLLETLGENQGLLMFVLITTVIFQWAFFGLIYLSVFREQTFLLGLGFRKIRWLDFAWAISFLLTAMLILQGLAWILAQIGMPMLGEVGLLIPTDLSGRLVWVGVSFTAGFCEESMFRGYLMTRLRLIAGFKSWVWPVVISAVAFGACHAYQGWPGFIVISVYGAMFSLLYIRTGSIWPGIIAHTFQDLLALVVPQ